MDTLGVSANDQSATQTAVAKIVGEAQDVAESNDVKALVSVVGALALQMEALNTRLADIDLTSINVKIDGDANNVKVGKNLSATGSSLNAKE